MNYQTDRDGLVTITNKGLTAKVLPESVEVWTERGWKVATKTEKAATPSNQK